MHKHFNTDAYATGTATGKATNLQVMLLRNNMSHAQVATNSFTGPTQMQ